MTSAKVTIPVMMVMVTHCLYPLGIAPIAHDIIQLAEHILPHKGLKMLQM